MSVNWNAAQTFPPLRVCVVCGKKFREDCPAYEACCSTRCEEKREEDAR